MSFIGCSRACSVGPVQSYWERSLDVGVQSSSSSSCRQIVVMDKPPFGLTRQSHSFAVSPDLSKLLARLRLWLIGDNSPRYQKLTVRGRSIRGCNGCRGRQVRLNVHYDGQNRTGHWLFTSKPSIPPTVVFHEAIIIYTASFAAVSSPNTEQIYCAMPRWPHHCHMLSRKAVARCTAVCTTPTHRRVLSQSSLSRPSAIPGKTAPE